jgi:(p)ppGpp synthase/HD superfamily hydrolase
VRKGLDVPYITHVVQVSAILAQYRCSQEVVLAGLLHDVVEDTGVSIADLQRQFGPRVAALVAGVTEQKRNDAGEIPWEERKAAQIAHLYEAEADVVALKAADALHNIDSIRRDLRVRGSSLWSSFKRGREAQLRYYQDIAAAVTTRLPGHGLAGELAEHVRALAEEAEAD